MAERRTVRALIPARDEATLREELTSLSGAGVVRVECQQPPPASHRDGPPHRLRGLWPARTGYLVATALLGALVGLGLAVVVPDLRDVLPYSAFVIAFGFAWGGAAFGGGRGGPADERRGAPDHEDQPDGDQRDGDQVIDLRLLTVEVQRDRGKVAEHLAERGAELLDRDT